MLDKMPPRPLSKGFKVQVAPKKVIQLQITEPDVRADQLSLTTWTSSFVLANQLHKLNLMLVPEAAIPILELGAGTGLVGITAAMLLSSRAILTDLPGIITGIQSNIDLNRRTLEEAKGSATCGVLDWTNPNSLLLSSGHTFSASHDKAGIIVAADTIYDEAHPGLLSRAILAWLAPGETSRVILTYPLRVAYLDQIRELWSALEAGGMVSISDGQVEEEKKNWDDECLCEWSVWRWKQRD